MQKNVFDEIIDECCSDPITGFYRDGFCNTDDRDVGIHTVCAHMTEDFLEFSSQKGNDLSTPRPEFSFPGLKEGDSWCLCTERWKEAYELGKEPRIYLRKTHKKKLEINNIENLKEFTMKLE